VVVDNGTAVIGLAASISAQLQTTFPSLTVVSKSDAQKSTYKTTLVIDLTGKSASQAAILAKDLKAKVGKLPLGETKPINADLLIILGKM
jgi:hypothetical protein